MRRALLLTLALAACGAASSGDADEVVLPRFTARGRWPDPRALTVRVDPSAGPVAAERFGETIERALDVWAGTGAVGFVPHAGDEPPDLMFAWAQPASADRPDSPFGRDTSVAVTGPLGPECTVLFDAGRPWVEAHGEGASLFQAAVHETGHALGLGHSLDRRAVLHPQRENGRTEPAPSDLDGLYSLYGGGRDAPGDLVVEGRDVPALRRIAPPADSGWTVLDTDGDGDDEVLVWASGEHGAGALTIYHFADGPRLERTLGPVLGIAGHGARVEAGAGALEVHRPDGTALRWTLDASGFPRDPVPVPWLDADAERPTSLSADLDGDGRPERLTVRP